MTRALITGVTGQDGRHLSELLLEKGYEVYGLIRGQHNPKRAILEREVPDVKVVGGDLTDQGSLISVLQQAQPDEVYNLGAMSFVTLSWMQPELTGNVTGIGALRMLEAIRILQGANASGQGGQGIRFYQASSSEMFGAAPAPQNEGTLFHPRSPYGVAKVFAHHITVNYREAYGLPACCGILFNHESPRRGENFVTRKITRGLARIRLGLQRELALGNLEARRDWGFAGDYVDAMWRMLQQDEPDDFVIATGQTHSIRELLDAAFKRVGIEDWEKYVEQDPRFFRPAEVDLLIGDASKAKDKLGWIPTMAFEQLIESMVDADLEAQRKAVERGED
ncbi:MAG TPA: GDP-mannose 4,6-dehydratase [Gemmatimonadaceae bacterium]|nr:GDP-mannose 4,6-dehydratase [Gemmatimonadaceae bacterium]